MKLSKIQQSPTRTATKQKNISKAKLLTLNDDCIDRICEWLPLASLASFGLTWNRVNQVANNYFRRKHPANHVLLGSSNGQLQFYPNEPYVKCFIQQFRNIMVYGLDMQVLNYAATTFKDVPIRKFGIFSADNLTEAHALCVHEIIRNAEFIEFTWCSSAGGLHEILKQCSNMRHLVLKLFTECKIYGQKNDWLLQKYPTLEHLHWGLLGTLPTELHSFFKSNPNVNSFYGTEAILPFIQEHNITLNTLILKVGTLNTVTVFEQLRELCERNAIQSLYLVGEFTQENDLLPKLNNLIGLSTKMMDASMVLTSFVHLKVINMSIASMKEAIQLAKKMVNLEEVYFEVNSIDVIRPFIRFSPKLTKILIDNTVAMKSASKMNLLNLEKLRKSLHGAKPLTIYLKEEAYLKIKNMSVDVKCDSVQIKSIETHITNDAFVRVILDK